MKSNRHGELCFLCYGDEQVCDVCVTHEIDSYSCECGSLSIPRLCPHRLECLLRVLRRRASDQ